MDLLTPTNDRPRKKVCDCLPTDATDFCGVIIAGHNEDCGDVEPRVLVWQSTENGETVMVCGDLSEYGLDWAHAKHHGKHLPSDHVFIWPDFVKVEITEQATNGEGATAYLLTVGDESTEVEVPRR